MDKNIIKQTMLSLEGADEGSRRGAAVRASAERPTRAQETSRCERGRSRSGTEELGFPQKSSGSAPVIAKGTAMSTTTRRSDARRLTKDLARASVGATRALHRSETRVEHDVSPRRSWDHGQRIE